MSHIEKNKILGDILITLPYYLNYFEHHIISFFEFMAQLEK